MDNNKYGTVRRRFFAGLIDGLVFMPLYFVSPLDHIASVSVLVLIPWYLLFEASGYMYSIIMHKRYGQTVGKMAMKVKVVTYPDEAPISYRRAILRDIGLIIPAVGASLFNIPYLLARQNPYEQPGGMSPVEMVFTFASVAWFLLEMLTALLNPQRRALHDYIAGTVVIKVPNQALFVPR
jgi:uncharacterized RDD family membrane protein YckC